MLIIFRGLDVVESCLVGRFLTAEDKVVRGLNAMYQLSGARRTVIVHHIHTDILHLLIHHPGHDAHDHDGKHDDETGQKTIAPYLKKLLMYEVAYHVTRVLF